MQTNIHPEIAKRPESKKAEQILRSCVHCGFCTATCPTYQHFGDERDGPRGRIYLIKQLLETNDVSENTQTHLDRCLNCRSCETTCPSGVEYASLLDIGRHIVEEKVPRTLWDRTQRFLLRKILPYPKRFGFLLFWGQLLRPLLPGNIKKKIPIKQLLLAQPTSQHSRKMLVLAGCAQSVTTPNTNIASARVLDKLGITLIEAPYAGCCGAVAHHLSAHDESLQAMRHNIDVWWPYIESGIEAIVTTASGCGSMVKEYGELLIDDPVYAKKAKKVAELAKDICEVVAEEDVSVLNNHVNKRTAYHCPCTLQHAQQLSGKVETILKAAGIPLSETKDQHLCCGSAGTYSILQSSTSQQLLDNKLKALTVGQPEQIVTANVGCQLHLATKSSVPVKHWIELLDE